MRVLTIGAGYVGLTSAACLASLGHEVLCCDIDRERIRQLSAGTIPIFEPGVVELIAAAGPSRLRFTAALPEDLGPIDALLICVGTPPLAEGGADLGQLFQLAADLAPRLRPDQLVLTKCSVPPGTNRALGAALPSARVVAVPEFLREGSAVHDFLYPDRLVFGVRSPEDARAADRVFARIAAPRLVTTWEGAELVKYAANAYLAVRLSFVNELARVCAGYGADILDVAAGMGLDRRIGTAYLSAGLGFGGSCLPKDIAAFQHAARAVGHELTVVAAAEGANARQLAYVVDLLCQALGGLNHRRLAVWGLAFKSGTDDLRAAPALGLIDVLLGSGALVRAHDPAALENARRHYASALRGPALDADPWDAARDAEALVLATDWPVYRDADLARLRACLAVPGIVLDARNALDADAVTRAGLRYIGVGHGVGAG